MARFPRAEFKSTNVDVPDGQVVVEGTLEHARRRPRRRDSRGRGGRRDARPTPMAESGPSTPLAAWSTASRSDCTGIRISTSAASSSVTRSRSRRRSRFFSSERDTEAADGLPRRAEMSQRHLPRRPICRRASSRWRSWRSTCAGPGVTTPTTCGGRSIPTPGRRPPIPGFSCRICRANGWWRWPADPSLSARPRSYSGRQAAPICGAAGARRGERDPARPVAYFSLEFGLGEAIPLYAGGLGVLAGDHLKAASDLGVPLIAIGLLYQEGYFRQTIDATGRQEELYPYNDPVTLPIQPALAPSGEWLTVPVELPGGPSGCAAGERRSDA